MKYSVYRPAAPLSGLVDHLWSLSDVPVHARERIVPNGTLELVINLDQDEFRIYDADDTRRCTRRPGAMVSGAYSRPFVIDTREHASILGVHFKPGGALSFLGAAPGELADAHVELEALWGRGARELRDQLCEVSDAPSRFRLLERALLAHSTEGVELHPCVRAALPALARGSSVGDVAAEAGVSQRRLLSLFSHGVGLSPKLFMRIRRFQRAFALAQSGPQASWSKLAIDTGYFDQSHMIRDFLEFSGLSPSEVRRRRRAPVKMHHVALP